MPTIVANGINIYYEQRGDGPPLLFFNGSGSTLASSAFLVDVFAARCAVTAHDQRGLGATDIPQGPYTMLDYANDANAMLDAIGIASCAVVGISFGGMVAQEFAIRFPDRVTRLALLCTSPGGDGGASYPLHELAYLAEPERAALAMRLLDTRFCDEWFNSHASDRFLMKSMAERALVPKSEEQMRGEYEQMQARRYHDVYDRLATIAAPTLVAAGRFDGIAPPSNAMAIADKVANATLKMYEGGHAFFAQDAAAFAEILDFLARGSDPMFHVVLVAPQIAGNTGAIIRLCANAGAQLHLIEPLGFHFEAAALRRAGLDYHDLVDTTVWPDLTTCKAAIGNSERWFAASGRGTARYDLVDFAAGDVFVFGCESDGLAPEVLAEFVSGQCISIPMQPDNRSINLANAVSIVVFEAWRQAGFSGAAARRPDGGPAIM